MYERSAIVLERYIEKILELEKTYNLKKNSEDYNDLINEIEEYQTMTEKGLKIIQEFDDTVKSIEHLQKEQARLYQANKKLEEDRNQLFNDLGEDTKILEAKLKKIEEIIESNNDKLKEIRQEYIQLLTDFSQKQKDRNKCEKAKRVGEANHIEYIKRIRAEFGEIEVKDVNNLKEFISSEKEKLKQDALNIMIKNGKNERVSFNQEVLKKAIKARFDIAEKEAECYILIYDRMKKLLAETDNDVIKLDRYKKVLRDTSTKMEFLKAEKEYIIGFLDYERMTAISGTNIHKKMMVEACNNFELDMIQIKNLYELIQKEIANKTSKKAYKELYNKTYLKNIEDKEKNFEEEVNNVNISVGTVINSNYWRIEGIKNIYNTFQEQITVKFERDLSEYQIEDEIEIQDEEEDSYYEKEPQYDYLEDYEEIEEDDDIEDEYEEDESEEYNDDDYELDEEIEQDDEENKRDKDEENYELKEENEFEDEDNIDIIIERSRKKAIKDNKKENKGIFEKFFKKNHV